MKNCVCSSWCAWEGAGGAEWGRERCSVGGEGCIAGDGYRSLLEGGGDGTVLGNSVVPGRRREEGYSDGESGWCTVEEEKDGVLMEGR